MDKKYYKATKYHNIKWCDTRDCFNVVFQRESYHVPSYEKNELLNILIPTIIGAGY